MTTPKISSRLLFLAGFLASAGPDRRRAGVPVRLGPRAVPAVHRATLVLDCRRSGAAGRRPAQSALLGRRLYGLGVVALAGLGAAVSTRHVWIQHLPPGQVAGCGADLDYMLQNFPLLKTVTLLWAGTSDCATVAWSFLGLSMQGGCWCASRASPRWESHWCYNAQEPAKANPDSRR